MHKTVFRVFPKVAFSDILRSYGRKEGSWGFTAHQHKIVLYDTSMLPQNIRRILHANLAEYYLLTFC
jgi:hypothetical protein